MIIKFRYIFLLLIFPSLITAAPFDDMVKELVSTEKFNRKSTVAVLPLECTSSPETGEFIAEEITRSMVKAGIKVVERRQLDKLIREISLQQTGLVSETSAAKIGRAAGARYMIMGSVTDFKKFGYENEGLKVAARLVEVSTFDVLSASTIEVDADDKVSPYRNKGVRKAAEYPCFLEFIGGGIFYNSVRKNDDIETEVELNPGFIAGLRYINENKGFFARGYEFNYQAYAFKDEDDFKIKSYNLNLPFFIRIPLWVYMPALPQFTNIYFGPSFGAGIFKIDYYKDGIEKDDATGIGFNTELIGGLKLGISENVSLSAEYRYKPDKWNPMWHSENSESYRTRIDGSMIVAAFCLAP